MITLVPSHEPNTAQKAQIARKYGMFIHFGINTFNNTEWSDGTLSLDSYAPDAIDANSWVRHAYEAGMNYVILITKHHDGFCLFDTDTTEYCVNNTKNPTDVVAEVAKACKKYGVKLALLFSLGQARALLQRRRKIYRIYVLASEHSARRKVRRGLRAVARRRMGQDRRPLEHPDAL
mgnify:CR=1 FL=1